MEIWYREKQVDEIARRLNIPKNDVDLVLYNYTMYLQARVNAGQTVKVLNICYLKNSENVADEKIETLAYISTEIANLSSMGRVTVHRILLLLEELIVKDLGEGLGFAIKGLIRIRALYENGERKVRIKKSTKYNSKRVTVVTLNAFRRKVASYNAR